MCVFVTHQKMSRTHHIKLSKCNMKLRKQRRTRESDDDSSVTGCVK